MLATLPSREAAHAFMDWLSRHAPQREHDLRAVFSGCAGCVLRRMCAYYRNQTPD